MKSFFKFFASRHSLANLITLMTILLGLSTLMNIKREMRPNVDIGIVVITTRYPGASPEDVELKVTNKIEEELEDIDGIERYTSSSMENISIIEVEIDIDMEDQEQVKSDIQDAVDRVTDLPPEVEESPLVKEIRTSIFPIIEVGIAGELPYRELREIAKQFKKKLEEVPGVSSVDDFGYLDREIKVEVDPEKIRKNEMPLREIITAIQGRNVRSTGGSFGSYTSDKNVVTHAQFEDPAQVGDVIIRSPFEIGSPVIRVKDVAVVKDEFEEPKIISLINGRQAISFVINKKESADIIRTVDAVKILINEYEKTLPDGVEVLISNDSSRFVRNRISVMKNNGLIGLCFIMILLTLFLNLRVAFWVALGLPVSLFGVIFLLPFFDVYISMVTLGGMIIVVGIIVDDGIIIAENIYRHIERGETLLKAAVDGISEVFLPVLTTVLTTIFAFAPMFFMQGIMGKFVWAIPFVITMALLISLGEAMLALPAHITLWMRYDPEKAKKRLERSWFNALRRRYEAALHGILRFRYILFLLFVVCLVASFWYASNYMKVVLFSPKSAERIDILVELPKGSSLQATANEVRKIEKIINGLSDKELDSFVTRVGSHGFMIAGENDSWATLNINLTPFATRTRTARMIVQELRKKANRLEGFDKIIFNVRRHGPPIGKPVVIRVISSDDTKRRELADSVAVFLNGIDGVKDLDRDDKAGKDQVKIDIDFDKLPRLGLTAADIAQNVRIAYDGMIVTSVRYGDEDVDFRVQLSEEVRKKSELLGELLIPNNKNRLISLRDVAGLNTSSAPSNYNHYNGERATTITGDIAKGSVTSIDVANAVSSHFDLKKDLAGTRLITSGEGEETQQSMSDLQRKFIIAAIGIYFLLLLLFNSATQPLIVMAAIPFGVIGVIIAFALHGEPFSFLAMMGIIGLSGVVVNDSLVLVNYINKLREKRPDENVFRLIAEGTAARLRAVLLTTFTTVAGLLPMAYGLGGTDPMMPSMALAMGYGLLFATPLTLILVPCLYAIGYDIRRIFRRAGKH